MYINFFETNISQKAVDLVNEVLKSGYISAGKMAGKFEEELQKQIGMINPVTVNSGTSALHLALSVAGLKKGDEVIIPAQTFIATGLAVLMQGATPVFADIQYKTGNIDPDSILSKITPSTKAIIPVHWGGYPCDLDEINKIARDYNLIVIEDAAHALGSTYNQKPIGSISKFTAFSFQSIKHLTTGDGGALCCLDSSDFYLAKRLRWFDIDRDNSPASILGEREYNAENIGYKYHMNDIAASLGLGNLDKFKEGLSRRQLIAARYRKELQNVSGLELLGYLPDRTSSYWLFTLLVKDRINFIKKLKSHGIPSSVVHLRIDKNQIFGGINKDLINQEKFNNSQISIPIHSKLKEESVDLIIKTIKNGW